MNTKITAGRKFMQEWNTRLVLNLTREKKSISQIEILRNSDLSAGTVTNITKRLRAQGFIKDIGRGKSSGGRRPTVFRFNPKNRYVISVAFFADEIKVAILDLDGAIQKKISFSTKPERGIEAVFKDLENHVNLLLSRLSIPKNIMAGLCVSVEGVVDVDTGSLVVSSHFGWHNVPIKNILEKSLGLKTFVESDGRTMALGEYWFGAGKKNNKMVCLDIDAGIGMAIISNGQIYYGAHQMEGELGHNIVFTDGLVCRCGKRGCLETIASGMAIAKRARELVNKGEGGDLLKKAVKTSDRLAVRAIFQKAAKGNGFARQIIQDVGYQLGVTACNIVNFVDPDIIVLTGYVIEEDPGILLETIRRAFKETTPYRELRQTKVVKGMLGEDASLVGCATLAYQDMFSLSFGRITHV